VRVLITAAAVFITLIATAHAEPTIQYPKMWAYLNTMPASASNFDCDYTSRTCQVWRGGMDWRVLTLIDGDDQKTILAHRACVRPGTLWFCFDLDTGDAWRGTAHVGYIHGPDRDGVPWSGWIGCNYLVCVGNPKAEPDMNKWGDNGRLKS
jgi:hypothetical protein